MSHTAKAGATDRQMENQTPMSHIAKAGATKRLIPTLKASSNYNAINHIKQHGPPWLCG